MKSFKIFSAFALSIVLFSAKAQTDKATTEKIVNEKRFTFVATTAQPLNSVDINRVLSSMQGNVQNAGNINLTSLYDVKITPDSVISYLPYYGRAFSAPYNSNEDSGYRFTSTKFDYNTEKGKKRGWRITVNTKDTKDNPRMSFTVTESGYATLSIISMNKQQISYSGYLKENNKN